MAARAVPLHNRLDNAAFYNQAIASDAVLNRLLTRFINYGPFAGEHWVCDTIPTMAHIITYVRYRRSGVDDPDIIKVRAGAIAECLGPGLADDRYFPHEEAVLRVRKIGTWLRNNMALIPDITNATEANYAQSLGIIRAAGNRFGVDLNLIEDAYPAIPAGDVDVSLHGAILLIFHAAVQGTEWNSNYALTSLIHLHMAIAKQGNVTTRFITKVRQGVMADLQVHVDLSPALVSLFWNSFRSGIDENNAQLLFANWADWIPVAALRLRLIVQQTAMTGLTVLACIGKAMNLHPNFSWAWVAYKLPVEMNAFQTAVQLVGDNTYYGYRRDLGPVSSTHYKTLGYIAYQLLLRGNGMQTLTGYKGWPRNVPADINAKIDEYIDGRAVAEPTIADMAAAQDLVDPILNIVRDEDNAAVYA